MWLNKVIQELYTKINNLTIKTYNAQLKLSKHHHPIEYNEIIESVNIKIKKVINKKIYTINKKLKTLKEEKSQQENNNNEKPTTSHRFNARVKNLTNIEFNKKEMQLLEKGLKHSIQPVNNKKNFNKHLLNIENTVLKTKIQDQQEIRTSIIADLSKKINNRTITLKTTEEERTANIIRKKVQEENSIITKADKGNTLVIMKMDEYDSKIKEYIESNEIIKLNSDPTKEYNVKIKQTINQSINTLSDKTIRYSKAIKPAAPNIKGLPKIHKQNIPLRPLINYTTAPAYKIAKHINNILKQHIKLVNNYSLSNNIELVDKIKSIDIPRNAKLASFDISNMYTNIPIDETIEITKDLLTKSGLKTIDIKEIINIITEITKQNYFQHNNEFYKQTKGLPMGSPISGTLADIYLNNIENIHILNDRNPYRKDIVYWYRYVDDIILLFKGTSRQLDKLHKYINNIQPNIKFTIETEIDNKINFLDLTITNNNSKHNFKIYRKPTQTDHTIHNESHHPHEHKISAYNHMINRLNCIPMSEEDYNIELNNIKYIANRNGYKTTLIDRINKKHNKKYYQQTMTTLLPNHNNQMEKYVSVEYNQNTYKIIRKTLKKFGYKTAYKNNNKLEQKLKKGHTNQPIDTGVYKITCNNCSKFYIGQTGRSFTTRFREHINDIQKTDPSSNYAQHIKRENHSFTDYNTNLSILHTARKGPMLNRLEELEIYKNKDNKDLMNDKINTKTNKIYNLIIKNNRNS